MLILKQKEWETIMLEFEKTDKKIIKRNIKKFIDNSDLDCETIARRIGVNVNSVYAYRCEKRSGISFIVALRLCNLLDKDITELFEGVEESGSIQFI